jgi:hypothetical protein
VVRDLQISTVKHLKVWLTISSSRFVLANMLHAGPHTNARSRRH